MTTVDPNDHGAQVDAWMARATEGLTPEQLVAAVDQGFSALWRRAHQTLGEVTLTAIADRVLHNAAELHPALAGVALEGEGLRCDDLRHRAASLPREQLTAGLRFVLVEFLTVLGNLTAEILTPALHAELAGVSGRDREDAKS